MDEKWEELKSLAQPLVEWLKKNYHPHVQIIIESDHVVLTEGLMAIPFEED
jgi:hypothetical protein